MLLTDQDVGNPQRASRYSNYFNQFFGARSNVRSFDGALVGILILPPFGRLPEPVPTRIGEDLPLSPFIAFECFMASSQNGFGLKCFGRQHTQKKTAAHLSTGGGRS